MMMMMMMMMKMIAKSTLPSQQPNPLFFYFLDDSFVRTLRILRLMRMI